MSCSEEQLSKIVVAPASSIERDVKGHEQIYSVQAILRLTQKRLNEDAYVAYGISSYKTPPVPIFQQIDLSKDDEGNVSITSERKFFDVVKSKKFYYGLELRYYDVNGKFINHQFSYYDEKDIDNSTLLHHQHFFTIQNYSLDGKQMVFPMTLDSVYYDRYTFQRNTNGEKVKSTVTSPSNIYVPTAGYQPNTLRYNYALAQRATEVSLTKDATKNYTDPATNKQYDLYKALDQAKLNELVTEIFSYAYRDTDPVEEVLYKSLQEQDDLGRLRLGKPVQRLQQKRDLSTKDNYDHLGFKGILQFYKSNIIFQMRISICHILTPNGKYTRPNGQKGINYFNEINPSWNTFDIDYPIAFRVIADTDGDQTQFVKDIQRFYPNANEAELTQMFFGGTKYFKRIPTIIM